MIDANHEPNGLRFFDTASRRDMLLVLESGSPFDHWICYRHPDGQWVSLRQATEPDMRRIAGAIGIGVVLRGELPGDCLCPHPEMCKMAGCYFDPPPPPAAATPEEK